MSLKFAYTKCYCARISLIIRWGNEKKEGEIKLTKRNIIIGLDFLLELFRSSEMRMKVTFKRCSLGSNSGFLRNFFKRIGKEKIILISLKFFQKLRITMILGFYFER